jgi:mono/diheme cytochrome c family protein
MKMTFRTIIIGGLVVFTAVVMVAVFVPALIWNPDQTVIAHPYTPEQEQGRVLFYSNGCNYCHTQYVRYEDTAMGPVSDGGNYVFDNPMILGSERTGPDLSYIGRKRSEEWEIRHLMDPREYSPLSIMPSFEFLPEEDLQSIATYLFALGDRVAEARMILPPEPYQGVSDSVSIPEATPVSDGSQGWSTWEAAGLQTGKEIYVDRCLTCHGCSGNGLGTYAGTLIVTPADFKQEPFRSMPDEQWFWHVSEGIPGTVMPTWRESLSEEERWAVINYVQQIFAQPFMRDPDEGDPPADYAGLTNPLPAEVETLDQGKTIFTRECMVCHGDSGRGDGPYGDMLQPSPPDFGDGSYGDYTDADYFWRISEGLPWSAMPTWRLRYSEEDRWSLVYYIRTIFTQTLDRPDAPSTGQNFMFPTVYADLAFPEDVSFSSGQVTFLTMCAHCHGLAGDGGGWNGQYLNPTPADFRSMAGMSMGPQAVGEHISKVSFGIRNTAMPTWGEFLPESERMDVVYYLMQSFMMGRPINDSVYDDGQIATNFLTLSQDNWTGEGHTISTDDGAQLYGTYCATCHGANGQGNGPGTQGGASGGPAAFTQDMSDAYVFWRVWEGVPESIMPPFQWRLSNTDVWDITAYVLSITSTSGGGS